MNTIQSKIRRTSGERSMNGRAINEIGNKHGKLTVMARAMNDKRNRAQWVCKCDCGNEIIVLGTSLRNGNTQSCGCLHKERLHEKLSLPFGEAAFNQLILCMKHSAKKRGYAWSLTNEQVRQLTSQPCYYCGIEPSQKHGASSPYCNGIYFYNGIDRVDNGARGYTIDNVVPACGRCNEAKNNMAQEEFKAWVCRIYEHFGSK